MCIILFIAYSTLLAVMLHLKIHHIHEQNCNILRNTSATVYRVAMLTKRLRLIPLKESIEILL